MSVLMALLWRRRWCRADRLPARSAVFLLFLSCAGVFGLSDSIRSISAGVSFGRRRTKCTNPQLSRSPSGVPFPHAGMPVKRMPCSMIENSSPSVSDCVFVARMSGTRVKASTDFRVAASVVGVAGRAVVCVVAQRLIDDSASAARDWFGHASPGSRPTAHRTGQNLFPRLGSWALRPPLTIE